jgi:hypothetical protein
MITIRTATALAGLLALAGCAPGAPLPVVVTVTAPAAPAADTGRSATDQQFIEYFESFADMNAPPELEESLISAAHAACDAMREGRMTLQEEAISAEKTLTGLPFEPSEFLAVTVYVLCPEFTP